MKISLTCIATILFTTFSFAQSSQQGFVAGPEWFEGTLMLMNGREISGLLKYNDKSDIVSLENGRESRSFTARHVKGFEFFDELEKRQRVFYSVEVEDRFYKVLRPLFFEVLLESREFAVISKISPIHLEKKEYATPALFNPVTGAFSGGRYYGYPSTITYTERLFLLNKDGELRPYLEITEKEIDGLFFDRSISKNKILDEDVLKRFIGKHYKEVTAFAEKNELNLGDKQGLLTALEFYKSLAK